MFVQLRRVVCLLVLLQCCLGVWVVHADSGGRVALTSENRELEEAERKVREWVKDSETALSEAGGCLRILVREEELCRANLSVLSEPRKKVRELEDRVSKMRGEHGDNNKNVPEGFEKLLDETKGTAMETKDAVANALISEARTMGVRGMCGPLFDSVARQLMELNDTRNRYTDILEKASNKESTPERADLVEGSKKKYVEFKNFTDRFAEVWNRSRATTAAARMEINEAEGGARLTIEWLGRIERNFESGQKTKFEKKMEELNAIRDSLGRRIEDVGLADIEAEIKQTQKKERQPIVGDKEISERGGQTKSAREGGERKEEEQAQRNGETQVKGEKGDGKAKEGAVGKNKGEKEGKEISTPNGTKITGDAERDVGVQNTIKNPQKPNGTSTAAPGTVNTGSGGVTSGSHSSSSSSSGTINFNVSGLSDGSSSPALLHSPLLLLLLCVLGSILVF